MLLKNLPAGSFLNRHKIADISSVFPSTTTASVTSIVSGLSPVEHGWLGWSCYFREVGECVNLFNNGISRMAGNVPAAEESLANSLMPFKSIFTQIADANPEILVCRVSPFTEYFADTLAAVCVHIERLCGGAGKKFIYAYHFQPDHDMHDCGCYSPEIKIMMRDFDKRLEAIAGKLSDTLMIITADHGLINAKMLCVEDFPRINECLALHPSIEPRCASFFVRDEFRNSFAERFNAEFAGEFKLYTKEQIIESGIFGPGTPHKKSLDFVGDFVAVATGGLGITYRNSNGEYNDFKASHAGLTKNEMLVPLIIIDKRVGPI